MSTRSTSRIYREFQGREPRGKVMRLYTPPGTPRDVSLIGPLIEIRLKNWPDNPIKFSETDDDALRNPYAFLAQAQRGAFRRLYVGVVRPLRRPNGDPILRSKNLGPALSVAYWAAKPHLVGHSRPVPWEHKFGDRGGRLPIVVLHESGTIGLRRGDYTVVAGGIDN